MYAFCITLLIMISDYRLHLKPNDVSRTLLYMLLLRGLIEFYLRLQTLETAWKKENKRGCMSTEVFSAELKIHW